MREFNSQGVCIPEMHYMVDTSKKLKKIKDLIDKSKYFTINKPRQYGKTTTMFLLERMLESEYLVFSLSFEGVGDSAFENEKNFCNMFIYLICENSAIKYEKIDEIDNFRLLSNALTNIINLTNKKIVLLIDEIDKSCDNQLFLSFLGMLRNKYLKQSMKKDTTFYSVILAGVHDVKTLKLKLRSDEEKKYNSPWNIATDFEVDLSFDTEEISTMLVDYCDDKKIVMDKKAISEKLFLYTSGYPFLVSKLCEIIDNKIMKSNKWEIDDVEMAVKTVLAQSNPNFDDLIKNLENDNELYEFIRKIVLQNLDMPFTITDNMVSLGANYGILRNENGRCVVHNKIYSILIYDHLIAKILRTDLGSSVSEYNFRSNFILNNTLNMEKILLKFQQFMKEQYNQKDIAFLEREGRLLLLAFIKPIINGVGFDFKEVQVSEEKRLDVVITFYNHKYVLELKRWMGSKAHEKGLEQLADYLERQGIDKGYLVVFDFNKNKEKSWQEDHVMVQGKDIYMVRV